MMRSVSFFLCLLLVLPFSANADRRKKRARKAKSRATTTGSIASMTKTSTSGLMTIKIGDKDYAFCQEERCGRIRKAAWPQGAEGELLKDGTNVSFTYRESRSGDVKFYIKDIFFGDKISGVISRCRAAKRGRPARVSLTVPMSNGRKKRFRLLLDKSAKVDTASCKQGSTVNASGKIVSRGKFQVTGLSFGNTPPAPVPTVDPKPTDPPMMPEPPKNDDPNVGVLPDLPMNPPAPDRLNPDIPKSFDGAKIFKAVLTKQDGCNIETKAYGEARLILWESEQLAIVEHVYKDLSSEFTASHVHYAGDDSIYVDININVSAAGEYVSWDIVDNVEFSPEQQFALLADEKFYVNIHTDKCPKGELKGTLKLVEDRTKNDDPMMDPPPKNEPPKEEPPKNDPPMMDPPMNQPPVADDVPISVSNISNNPQNIARFLNQATFGATPSLVDAISKSSPAEYFAAQLNVANNKKCYLLPKVKALRSQKKNASTMEIFQEAWWDCALSSTEDEVCHRVAFALSQQWVVSGKREDLNFEEALAVFHDILKKNCFGNIRNLMTEATISAPMGRYLDMINLSKIAFNENYARELLQLFTLGTVELNLDGSSTIRNGKGVPTYTQDDIQNLSRAFSGWTWSSKKFFSLEGSWSDPMAPVLEEHVTGDKDFMSITIPGNLSQMQQVQMALNHIFSHKNICPFTSVNLIKQLVTSNPSGDYIRRVSNACEKDANGVRGSLKAMVNAVLTDPEARDLSKIDKISYGKLRQPIMVLAHLLKIGKAKGSNIPKGCLIKNIEDDLQQSPLYAPSVFSFFETNYSTTLGNIAEANLEVPEFQILNQTSIIDNLNMYTGITSERKFSCSGANVNLDLSEFDSLSKDDLLSTLDLILTGNDFKSSSGFMNLVSKYVGNESDSKKRVSKAFEAILSSQKFIIRK